MKRKFYMKTAALVLASSLLFSSCIGSFSLTSRFASWNQTIDSNRFVNAILFVVFIPAYMVTLVGDALLFNTIEFWTGSNPVEAGVIKEVQGENGVYLVETLENGYRIEDENGVETFLIYDKESNTWSKVDDGKATKLITINKDKNDAIVYLPDGREQNVELSNEGLLEIRKTMQDMSYMAAR
ncbi:DUF3332 domain-containing protein [Dysgonomonas sp. 511]|uniref:DUF3332 domain-containing protein n=1 Tax=Dysgonomonas sp. 511 TaxID=2302930 RepID=UPI0013D015F5|nr:DUF3332 domain-containing protein [Dysgonomonas sp. 511]NDV78012.1 DUF3332 domain-containing protein [Dysgonomonas sp. 511]